MSEFRIRLPSPTKLTTPSNTLKRKSSSTHLQAPSPSTSSFIPNTSPSLGHASKRKKRGPPSSSSSSPKRREVSSLDPQTLQFMDQWNQNSVLKTSTYQLEGLEMEKEYLLESLQRTVEGRESTSIFVLGPHGSGKTLLINSVLETLAMDHAFLTFELNGLLYPNEKSVFKDFAKQLRVHEDEMLASFTQEEELSTPQLLIWLIEQFQSTTQARLPWVIVLDHVEHFTRHARQSFLYALLDTTTHSFSPPWTLAVIGVSTNLDLPHLLEKRVKSRFSQTIVQVPSLSSLSSSSSIPSFLFHALNPKDLDPRVNACAFLQTQLHFPKLKDPIPFLTVFHLTLLQPCQTPQTLTSLFPCIQSMYPHCTLALLLQGLLELTQFGYLSSSSSTTTSSSSSRRVTQVGCTEVSPCTWKWYQLSQVGFHQLQTKVYQHLNLPPFHDRPLPGIGPSSSSSATKRNIKKIRN